MANNPVAKKAIRKIARRTEVNKARRSRVRTYLRKFEEALAGGDAGSRRTGFRRGSIRADAGRLQGRGSQEHRVAQSVAPRRPVEEVVRRLISRWRLPLFQTYR